MAQPHKLCPNCGQTAARGAAYCSQCGTPLTDVAPIRAAVPRAAPSARLVQRINGYDQQYGETDLLESAAGARRLLPVLTVIVGLLLIACMGAFLFAASQLAGGGMPGQPGEPAVAITGGPTSSPLPFFTNTPRPTLDLPTVTPAPPTPTPTETPGPCQVTVQAGDGLITLAGRCGHRSMDVIPLILDSNGLSSAESLQIGQTLIIPWPTPTFDPNAPTRTPVGGAFGGTSGGDLVLVSADGQAVANAPTPLPTERIIPTETMLPGVAWHVIQPNENMLIVADIYNTNAETLAQLNPEIAFSQCDFSLDTGGPRCTVFLSVGQRMRVPAPTPTPTLSPTLSGSETPTPTATPTFNAPNPLSPLDRSLFLRNEIITLRWVTTGSLSEGDVYRVTVRDLTSGQIFTADTGDLFFILPADWQGADSRLHEYEWTISVYTAANPTEPTFTTPPRVFSWEGRQIP